VRRAEGRKSFILTPEKKAMRFYRGQGATQLASPPTYRHLLAQGATEYLVLLAVVLIVALVSVALLGFFPGMASDSQITQSQMYWKSASPISIVESGSRYCASCTANYVYMRMVNVGNYPIRITAVIGGDGGRAVEFAGYNCGIAPSFVNITNYFYMAPGEEKYFGGLVFGTACDWRIMSGTGTPSYSAYIAGASSVCQNSNTTPGTLDYKSIGFEYIAYIDGQQITKRQVGKDFIVKCMPPY